MQELDDHGFTDWPGVLSLAAVAAADAEKGHHLLGLPTLLLDLPVRTGSEAAFIHALSSRSSENLVTVPANDTATLARMRNGLGVEMVDLDSRVTSHAKQKGSLQRIQRHLFNEAGPCVATRAR